MWASNYILEVDYIRKVPESIQGPIFYFRVLHVMLLKFSNMLLCMQFGVVNSYMSIQYPNYFCIPNILNILPNSEKVYPLSSAVAIDFSAFEIA